MKRYVSIIVRDVCCFVEDSSLMRHFYCTGGPCDGANASTIDFASGVISGIGEYSCCGASFGSPSSSIPCQSILPTSTCWGAAAYIQCICATKSATTHCRSKPSTLQSLHVSSYSCSRALQWLSHSSIPTGQYGIKA